MIDVLIWAEVIRDTVIAMSNMVDMNMSANVCLAKLIQDGSRSLRVNSGDLCHHLTVVVMRIVIVLASCSLLLRLTYLLCTSSF